MHRSPWDSHIMYSLNRLFLFHWCCFSMWVDRRNTHVSDLPAMLFSLGIEFGARAAGCRVALQCCYRTGARFKTIHINLLPLSSCSSRGIAWHGAIHLCVCWVPKLCNEPDFVQRWKEGVSWWCQREKRLDLGVFMHVMRIPEETSQELTEEANVTASRGRHTLTTGVTWAWICHPDLKTCYKSK